MGQKRGCTSAPSSTERRAAFEKLVAAGVEPADAYGQVFSVGRLKPETIRRKAQAYQRGEKSRAADRPLTPLQRKFAHLLYESYSPLQAFGMVFHVERLKPANVEQRAKALAADPRVREAMAALVRADQERLRAAEAERDREARREKHAQQFPEREKQRRAAEKRRRRELAALGAADPVRWRKAAQRDLEKFTDVVIDRKRMKAEAVTQVLDTKGIISAPAARAVDTVLEMLRKGTISRHQYDAGVRFRDDFDLGQCEPLRAASLMRVGGRHGADIAGSMHAARARVGKAIRALGGMGSPGGDLVWEVVGRGLTILDYCRRRPWGRDGAPLSRKAASLTLRDALLTLDAHYYPPRGEPLPKRKGPRRPKPVKAKRDKTKPGAAAA